MTWLSFVSVRLLYMIFPQGSDVFGNSFAKATAGLLNRAGSTRLLTNGALKVICRTTLQAGEVKAVKSPASIAGVGTNAMRSDGSWRGFVRWYPSEKYSLSLAIGQ